jgi:hypothetical protein
MKKYIVVDENNNWLFLGEFKTAREAVRYGKKQPNYEGGSAFAFEVTSLSPLGR